MVSREALYRRNLKARESEEQRHRQLEGQRRRARIYAAYKRQQEGRASTKLDQSLLQVEIDAYAKRRADAAEEKRIRLEEFRREMEAKKKERQDFRARIRSQTVKFRKLHMAAQEGRCAHCGVPFDSSVLDQRAELDHKAPLVGNASRHTPENTWLLCHLCHLGKTRKDFGVYPDGRVN